MNYDMHKPLFTNRRGRRARLALIPRKDESQQHGNNGGGQSGGDNQGGNQGGTSNESGTADNNGQTATDYSKFWEEPGGDKSESSSKDGSAGSKESQSGSTDNNSDDGPTLGDQIAALNLGNSVMTDDVVKELAEGKTEKFHANLNRFGQQTVENTIRMMIPILGQVRDQLRQEMAQTADSKLKTDKDEAALIQAIPSAADPKIRPQVDRVYQQSLKHTKGDRTAAIAMTKEMLRIFVDTTGDDIGLAPRTPGDSAGVSSNVDWLAELSGR